MRPHGFRRWWVVLVLPALAWPVLEGCQAMSDRLTRWTMLGQAALEDPIQSVGGEGIIFAPVRKDRGRDKEWLASAPAGQLVAYYAPIFVQQRTNSAASAHPYPP